MKTFFKRTLAFLLCTVMLVSCWVFTAPSAVAADQASGNYYVEIDVEVTNKDAYNNQFIGPYFFNKGNSGVNDMGGIVLFYKDDNGRKTETTANATISTKNESTALADAKAAVEAGIFDGQKFKSFGLGSKDYVPLIKNRNTTYDTPNYAQHNIIKNNGQYTIATSISGFPTSFAVYNNNYSNGAWGVGASYTDWQVTQLRIGSDASNMKTVWEGGCKTSNCNESYPSRYIVYMNGDAQVWYPSTLSFRTGITTNLDNNYVFCSKVNGADPFGALTDNTGGNDIYKNDVHSDNTAYRRAWALPQPTFNSFSFANSGSYTAADGVTATLSSDYTYKTTMTDQYGVQLAGSFTEGGFVWDSSEISANNTDWSTDSSGVTVCNFDNTTSLYNVGISPVKANGSRYHRFGVKPSTQWTLNGDQVNVNGASGGMYYGQIYKDTQYSSYDAVSTVTFDYAPHAVAYQYKTTGTPLAAPADSDGDGIFESMTAAIVNTVSDYETNSGYAAFYGDDVTAVPASDKYSVNHYYDASGHYAVPGGTADFTAYGTITHDDTKLMNYTLTSHSYSDWTEISDDDITEAMAPANYHRRICDAVAGEEHYQYQPHNWNAGVVSPDPTCSSQGTKTFTCLDCSATKTEAVAINPTAHNWSGWAHAVPAADGTAVIDTVRTNLASYNEATHCFRYCTLCGVVETQLHDMVADADNNVAATCTVAGANATKCSVCGKTDSTPVAARGHSFTTLHQQDVTDNGTALVYYTCTNGCGNYCPATVSGNTYVADAENLTNNFSEIESNETAQIPTPYFNSHLPEAQFYTGIQYQKRMSSFKYDPEPSGGDITQTLRFCGSVKVPDGVSVEDITAQDSVLDFGFVYSLTRYICPADSEHPDESYIYNKNTADPTKLVYNPSNQNVKYALGYKVYKMSVAENNAANGTSIAQWTGVTVQNPTGSSNTYLSFNLVIPIKIGNWAKEYAARPYITYTYKGQTYTVYDGGISGQNIQNADRDYSYSHRSIMDLAESIMGINLTNPNGDTIYDFAKTKQMPYEEFLTYVPQFLKDKTYAYNRLIKPYDAYHVTKDAQSKSYYWWEDVLTDELGKPIGDKVTIHFKNLDPTAANYVANADVDAFFTDYYNLIFDEGYEYTLDDILYDFLGMSTATFAHDYLIDDVSYNLRMNSDAPEV